MPVLLVINEFSLLSDLKQRGLVQLRIIGSIETHSFAPSPRGGSEKVTDGCICGNTSYYKVYNIKGEPMKAQSVVLL